MDFKALNMEIGERIKKIREARGLSQKEVAGIIKMDQSQYSKIEKDKTDPALSTMLKVAKALGIQLSELFAQDDAFRDVNSYDKSVMEKIALIDQLDEDEKKSIFKIIDGLISKKKMKDSLTKALAQ
jgi:transcriptional regulator with XRE-family HTH domain